ncbi:putative bifunctional diguanylate cyclase/phosphodiesterase [Muricoccus aerilatus]|uniref:putative bifunctional diguanylate cyclase/phosphodiesterase n=1 Tax=Muricoccus aerilatus TaxID=452982 RepID=UPI000693AB4B|nr:EAL domain-containing protein [Roseomonas aerilata]
MAGRLFPLQTLRARLIVLSVAPSLICVLVLLVGVPRILRDLGGPAAGGALRAAAARLEAEVAGARSGLAGLAGVLSREGLLREELALAAGAEDPSAGADLLSRLLTDLRRADPAIRTVEATATPLGGPPRRWVAQHGSPAPELAVASATAFYNLPGGARAELRLAAFLDPAVARRMLGTSGRLALVSGEVIRGIDPPGEEETLPELPPAWRQMVRQGRRAATGFLTAEHGDLIAALVPLDGPAARKGVLGAAARLATVPPPRAALLLRPAEPGLAAIERRFRVLGGVAAAVLVVLGAVTVLAARRLAAMLAALTEALSRLGQGDAAVQIPRPPRGASRELIELTEACTTFRDAAAERTRLSERLRWLANFDGLTGLPNRALMGDRLELAFAAARRDGMGLVVFAMDLDHFKEVNDTLGHAAGDEVLRVVAARLRGCLRATDTLARIGGDEFVLVAPGLDGPAALSAFAARLLAAMEDPVPVGPEHRAIGLSIGAAVLPPNSFDDRPEALLQDADLALYQAKAAGGSCLRIFEPGMDERLRTRRALIADLRMAMERQELTILFQPQVSTATRRIKGAEALLRWYHPQRGLIGPDIFIPLAEETGLIVPIGAWVLEEACQVARSWGGLHLAVNVSPIQVRQAGFVGTVERALSRSGLPPERLELEITEATMLTNTAETLAILSRLRSLGVRLAMDDFGTGYSSLATLQRFRFDKIKVDRSFIRHLEKDPKAVALLRAVIALGSALDVITNAEGVEEEGQLSMLRAEGCEEAQGYLFGKPMSAAEFRAQAGLSGARAA